MKMLLKLERHQQCRKAKQEALISELDRLKEMNLMSASLPTVKSLPPLDEERSNKKLHHLPIESSFVIHPIFMFSGMIVVGTGIYFYKDISLSAPLTIAPLVAAAVLTLRYQGLCQHKKYKVNG